MNPNQKIIGIDLGTTNSVVAVVEGNEPVVVPNQEGANKTPSVVAFLDNNECIVGEIARRQAATNPLRTVTSIKRLIGAQYEDVEEYVSSYPYQIVNHNDRLLINVNGMGYSPEQISALVLRKLKESAEAYLGEEVSQAVITVPAHFDDNQRNSTMEAAKLAGLEVLRLINEPTAAALAYGIGRAAGNEEVIAVYDFGGGTFDITILEISNKTFEVLTSTGDNHLGGDDLDNALVALLVDEFEDRHRIDLTQDPVTLRRLKEVAEKAKCELSSTTQTVISLPFITYKEGQPLHLERQITRDEFEEIIESFINRTVRCCKRALDDAGINKRDIKKVILVGGSTRIPLVQDLVEDFFGIAPFKGINPDEVVALGAATQAGVFSGNIEEVTLIDVSPHSLGIEVKDGKFSRIIEKNATIPIKAAKNFTTTEDNQTFVNIHILQGESDDATENRSLGRFTLADIPAMVRGRARIRVTFFMNADGVMEISAEELGSGVAKSLTIMHSQLDENERRTRKKARQRRTGGGRKATARPSSGEESSQSRRSGSSSGGAVDPVGSGVRLGPAKVRNADSSIVPLGTGPTPPPAGFSVTGDTGPGQAPHLVQSKRVSQEAVPLPTHNPPITLAASAAPQQPMPPAPPAPPPVPIEPMIVAKAQPPVAAPPPPPPAPPQPSAPPRQHPADQPTGPEPVPTTSSYPNVQRYTRATGAVVPPPAKSSTPDPIPPSRPAPAPAAAPAAPPPTFQQPPAAKGGDEQFIEPAPGSSEWDMPTSAASSLLLPPEIEEAFENARKSLESSDAQRSYARALELFSDEPLISSRDFDALFPLAYIQLMMGQLDELRSTMGALTEYYHSTHGNAIAELYERATGRFTMAPMIRRDRSRLRELIGDLDGACEDLEFASKMDPKEGDLLRLEDLYRLRVRRGDDPAAQFKLVKTYLKSNRVDEAIELLQDLQHVEAYETRATKILGLCHWQKNLHFLAWQKFKQLKQNEEIRDILYRLGNDMESTGQLNNALTVYEHIASESGEYRDVSAKIKKLRYRIKMHQDEADQSKVSNVLTDPRFTIIEEINRGSMGIIYKAHDKTLDEIVALKVLNDYLTADPAAVERFKREARAAKKLSHPYIVRIHDMFETGSKRFISMEYIEGTDMKRMMADRTSFSEDQLVYYFLQICDALAYAHKLNVVHRDIKPANIMITKQNMVKVTDFGIAKILKGDDSTKSGTAVIGTPLYMAPEQITGEGVDARSDIYALGIMMYELVSGHPPFYLGNIEYHHIHTAPPPLPDRVSEGLRAVIMKCVAKNPAHRFQMVEDIFNALQVDRK